MKYIFSYIIEQNGFRLQVALSNSYTSTKSSFNASKHMCLTTRFDIFVIRIVVFEV